MKSKLCFFLLVCSVFAVSGRLHAIGEKTISLAGRAAWDSAELKDGIAEVGMVRSRPVLVLASSGNVRAGGGSGEVLPVAASLDLAVSFDEGKPGLFRDSVGNYRVIASPHLEAVEQRYARAGSGAVLFGGQSTSTGGQKSAGKPLVIEAANSSALFAPGRSIRDFSVEFWLYPLNLENGEQILSWVSSRPSGTASGDFAFQRVSCVSSKNRLQWSFLDFFASPDGSKYIDITVTGNSPVVPKAWSHHLIRFDSRTGMLEYLVNGNTEAIEYANSTGHEGGDVYCPVAGEGGSFALGGGFMGMMDEFRVYSAWVASPLVRKYPKQGGRLVTRPVDLGEGNSSVVKIEALGGKTLIQGTKATGEFRENGRFRFSDDSEIQFFVRAADRPYQWDESQWLPFTPGANLAGSVQGRYVQLAADFYPSFDGESSPYLEELRITYLPNEPPLPPASLVAVALDGGVQLRWKSSPDADTAGYLVYYGETAGEYRGTGAALGSSPVDAGKRNSIFIDGLKNGTLYYFRVAAYDWQQAGDSPSYHAGEFSREVRARPLQRLSALSIEP